MIGYYDLVLGLIPLTLAGVSGLLVSAGTALTTAIPIAGLVAVALIGHAMFVRGPVDSTRAPPGSNEAAGFQSAD